MVQSLPVEVCLEDWESCILFVLLNSHIKSTEVAWYIQSIWLTCLICRLLTASLSLALSNNKGWLGSAWLLYDYRVMCCGYQKFTEVHGRKVGQGLLNFKMPPLTREHLAPPVGNSWVNILGNTTKTVQFPWYLLLATAGDRQQF